MRWLFLAALSVAALLVSSPSDAQDVYNFYFQKNGTAPNPQVAVPGPVAVPTPAQVSKEEGAKPEQESRRPEMKVSEKTKFNSWEITLGYGSSSFASHETYEWDNQGYNSNLSATGYALTGGYRFNKFVFVDATAYWKKGMDNANRGEKYLDGALGLGVTPLHLNVFGYELLEFGFTAGVATGRKIKTIIPIVGDEQITDEKSVFGPYGGLRIAVNITEQLALVADGRQLLGSAIKDNRHYNVGVRYRF